MQCNIQKIGKAGDQDVELYELVNDHGMKVRVMTYGATLTGVDVPDRDGNVENVTLHLDTLAGYLAGHPCFGSVPGRYANRIGGGKFTLDGEEYSLAVNNGPNHLHGGVRGFDKYVWKAAPFYAEKSVGVELQLRSPDGDEGYPGTLDVTVRYELTNENELWMNYIAKTDRPTVLNLTNHAYWNLRGSENHTAEPREAKTIWDHELRLYADKYLPADEHNMVTGQIAPVADTVMDFTEAKKMGAMLPGVTDGSAPMGAGYDHCFVVSENAPAYSPLFPALKRTADVYEAGTGRTMTVFTTMPGVQFYTANWNTNLVGSRLRWNRWTGFCLETQFFPDSPNRPDFPSTTLRPGETFGHTSVFRFGVRNE